MQHKTASAASVQAQAALDAVIPTYMSETSAALYARWWQLETWLRELIYVELRSRHGVRWVDEVKSAFSRLEQDAVFTHMAGADTDNPLAFLDYSQLLQVINANWSLFAPVLIERESWSGRQPDTKRIRHRIGHVRRPHADDLGRIEQLLRDLERGAFIACASYNDDFIPDIAAHQDPVTVGWIGGRHEVAGRLLGHADRQYGVRALVRVSRRPGATVPANLENAAGLLWHVDFLCRDGGFDALQMWADSSLDRARQVLVHLIARDPFHFRFTFAAADDSAEIADAIGDAFDVLLTNRLRRPFDFDDIGLRHSRVADVDYRLQSNSAWAVVDPSTFPISMFASGGEVSPRPHW